MNTEVLLLVLVAAGFVLLASFLFLCVVMNKSRDNVNTLKKANGEIKQLRREYEAYNKEKYESDE